MGRPALPPWTPGVWHCLGCSISRESSKSGLTAQEKLLSVVAGMLSPLPCSVTSYTHSNALNHFPPKRACQRDTSGAAASGWFDGMYVISWLHVFPFRSCFWLTTVVVWTCFEIVRRTALHYLLLVYNTAAVGSTYSRLQQYCEHRGRVVVVPTCIVLYLVVSFGVQPLSIVCIARQKKTDTES